MKLKKQSLLDRHIWYAAWVPWGNLVSSIPGDSLGLHNEIKKTKFVGYADLVCGTVPWDYLVSLIPWEFPGYVQGTRETEFVG